MNDQVFRHDPRQRFEVANANRATILRKQAEDKQAEDATRVEQDKTAWHGSSRVEGRVGGTVLDPQTAQAKRDRDDDLAAGRTAATPPPLPLSPASIEAVTVAWLQMTPDFYNSEFNRTSMSNFCRMNVEKNGAVFGIELLEAAFHWLSENNHLEKPPLTVRKRGEVTSQAAPVLFEYEAPEQREAREQAAREVAISIENEAERRAKNVPFEELQKEARSGYKIRTRQQADGVVGAIR